MGANQEVQDLITIAQLTPVERSRFLRAVKQEMKDRHISLDFFSTCI